MYDAGCGDSVGMGRGRGGRAEGSQDATVQVRSAWTRI